MQISICLWAFSLQDSVETLHVLGPQIKLVISTDSKVLLSFCVPTLLSICAAHQTNLKTLLHHCVISHLINPPVLWIFSPSLVQLYTSFLRVGGSIADLQCCISFRCTAKWISYTYTYILLFLDSFPIKVITFEHWVKFPVLYLGPY